MPIYEYVCESCGKVNEVLQKAGDPAPAKCEDCGGAGPLKRVVSRTSFVLKGGGWYSDLYGSSKKPDSKPSDVKTAAAGASGDASKSAPAASSSTSEASKPAAPAAAASLTLAEFDAIADRPHGIHERQAGPVGPFQTEVVGVAEAGKAGVHRPVADEQHGIGARALGRCIDRQLADRRMNAVLLAKQNLHESRARPRAFI